MFLQVYVLYVPVVTVNKVHVARSTVVDVDAISSIRLSILAQSEKKYL